MNFVKADLNEMRSYTAKSDLAGLLEDIVKSGMPCVEIREWKHKTIDIAVSCLRKAASNAHLKHLKVKKVGDKIFVINTLRV